MKTIRITTVFMLISAFFDFSAHAQRIPAGSRHAIRLVCPTDRFASVTASQPEPIWREVIRQPGASYIAVHFAGFALGPADYLDVRGEGRGQPEEVLRQTESDGSGRWTRRIQGDTAVLELFAAKESSPRAIEVDCYTAGYPRFPAMESVIGGNDLENAACYRDTPEYEHGKPVARLLVHSSDADYWGTGFLVSAQDHFLTARHLISNSAEAASAEFEFMLEAPNCSATNCEYCYRGTILTGSQLVKVGSGLDFTLVRIKTGNPAAQYGFLELEAGQPVVGEEIYIPQHPSGWAKEFAVRSGDPADAGGICRVQSLTADSCDSTGLDVGYYADTEPGSSGSPVLARATHRVIAVHHCGVDPYQPFDMNKGVPSWRILEQVRCALGVATVDRTHAELGDQGGDVQVQVNGCSWTVTNPCSEWIKATPLSGTGVKIVTLSVRTNYDCSPRSCEVKIGNNSIAISQAAGRGVAFIYPRAATFGPNGGTGTIEASGDPSCSWTHASDSDWIVITGVEPDDQKIRVKYAVAPAVLSAPRSGSIVIAGWRHAVEQTPPVLAPTAGVYNGLFSESESANQAHSGFMKLTATAKGTFSGSLQIGSRRYSLSGAFDTLGLAIKTIPRTGDSTLTLRLLVDGTNTLSGTVGDDTWTANLVLQRAIYEGQAVACPETGSYTIVFEGQESSPTLPVGTGYGTLKVDRAGRVKLSGSLADGTIISQSASLGPQGQWPLYIPLYSGKGSLQGQVLVKTGIELDGNLSWTKPALPTARYYPAGFVTQTHLTGSGFSGAVFDTKVLPITDGELLLNGGTLPGTVIGDFILGARNKVTPTSGPRLSLALSTSTGAMTGRVLDPFSSKWLTFKGVVLQRSRQASGYFLSGNQSGWVTARAREGL